MLKNMIANMLQGKLKEKGKNKLSLSNLELLMNLGVVKQNRLVDVIDSFNCLFWLFPIMTKRRCKR